MRLATFNANSIRSRQPIILDWLAKHSPDVLCIQETKVQDRDFPKDPFVEAGYHVAFKGEKAYNGVAILSRQRMTATRFGFDDGGSADASRLQYARVGRLHVVNTYVPQGREITHAMFRYKLEWFARLRTHFEAQFSPRSAVVWLGDLNVAPTPDDVHNPERRAEHVCYHADVRAAFERTREWGFEDVFRKHNPGAGHYSFFDYRTRDAVGRRMGWRLDHILATRTLAARCVKSFIDVQPRLQERPSDHAIVVADFDL